MNTTPPLLPETTFKPLSASKLDAMITHAMSHQQLPQQNNVIAFRRPWMFGTGMAAMAASIMFAFLFTPQYTTVATGTGLESSSVTADVSDLILLDTIGA